MLHPYLTRAFYEKAHAEHGCFPKSLAVLCAEAERLAGEPTEARGFLYLVKMLRDMGKRNQRIGGIALSDGMRMTNALAIAALVPEMIDGLMQTGFPREISEKTVLDVDDYIMASTQKGEAPGLNGDLMGWFLLFIGCNIVRIGRLNFERISAFKGRVKVYENEQGEEVVFPCGIGLNREGGACQHGEDMAVFAAVTEEDGMICGHKVVNGLAERAITRLPRSRWHLALEKGDPVIGIHIPRDGDFDPVTLENTYTEAMPLLQKCWSELKPKALVCQSWLMDRALQSFLRQESNIVQFQKPYTQYPARADNTSALKYVFGGIPERYEDLPEDNSMRRGMKALYLSGKCVRTAFAYRLLRNGERKL